METAFLGVLLLFAVVYADIYRGCFSDNECRFLNGNTFSRNDMTPMKCSRYCRHWGYRYFGVEYSKQCFCGNTIDKIGYRKQPGKCSAKCAGDKRQICGGNWHLSVYRITSGVYLGCYEDKPARLLNSVAYRSTRMTVQRCFNFCKIRGYAYFGVQNERECFCGNNIYRSGYSKKPEKECSAKCSGNKMQTCGGKWRLSVYQTNFDYMGCYLDKPKRLLGAKQTNDKHLTIGKCLKSCSEDGYRYAGVQNAIECFCGDHLKSSYCEKPESQCSAKCGGDHNQKCGGAWRLNVYRSVPDMSQGVYLGCFVDKKARLLGSFRMSSKHMTIQMCHNTCKTKGFAYYGVQFSSQCFCGNKFPRDGYRKTGGCVAKCSGRKSQICGGTWRISVYRTNAKYLACYVDKHKRLLSGKETKDKKMTLEKCFEICSKGNFKYAGLEAGAYCFCGKKLNYPGYSKRPKGECNAACHGDRKQICGGPWRLSVYII